MTNHEKALCALLHLAYESEADLMVDIILDALNGHDLMEHYENDAVQGEIEYKELKEDGCS